MSPDKAMIGYLQARIAELEAELVIERGVVGELQDQVKAYGEQWRYWADRAEKAEAEVERLKADCERWHVHCIAIRPMRSSGSGRMNPSGSPSPRASRGKGS